MNRECLLLSLGYVCVPICFNVAGWTIFGSTTFGRTTGLMRLLVGPRRFIIISIPETTLLQPRS